MSEGDSDISALIAASVGGDESAKTELIQRFYPKVQTIVHHQLEQDFRKRHKWILPLFSTRDVVHDVFAAVVAGLDESATFPDEGAFIAYLATMVRNRLLDAVRHHEAGKRDARRRIEGGNTAVANFAPTARSGGSTPDIAADLAEQAEALREILDGFPERQRALLTLRMMDGETYPEIAKQLGFASAETARQSFVDAQAKLLVKLRMRGIG